LLMISEMRKINAAPIKKLSEWFARSAARAAWYDMSYFLKIVLFVIAYEAIHTSS